MINKETVFDQMEQIRSGGLTNMMDRSAVRDLADAMGFQALVRAIDTRHKRGEYGQLLREFGAWHQDRS